ncbi:NAD(P)/FAD-dependent oxidoreductase [Acuticoccus sp. I52.16.1]|uniref:FAD/NAD(P)-dependent oxidoreductase n=1 Tax=Acuticoccus sp. I52.16.1 TaxID=2928472 RepID=UPI001FD2E31C|nr:NAD(P)/FAD-dependent oxidoreductase [Acuticoccus sp. I52.16.1]UOM34154.1 NAD(P)/FAD-dependent oxidoreductase [Acuticoccus sp. I52.16.1]
MSDGTARPLHVDVAVVGAGPAGATAAIAACAAGARVVVVDEADAAGGQIWRRPALPRPVPALDPRPDPRPDPGASTAGAAGAGPDRRRGDALREALASSGAVPLLGVRLWSVLAIGGRFRLDGVGGDGPVSIDAARLVVATGTSERVVPFAGWTTPGVVGLAATTILLKAFDTAPGRRTLVAGAGPLLAAVAAGIIAHGGTVAGIVDLNGRADWVRALPALARQPALALKGAGWLAAVRRAGVPVWHRHAVRRAHGGKVLEAVEVGPVDPGGRPCGPTRAIAVDALAIGNGLSPGTEITRLLRAEHTFDRARGGWHAVAGPSGATTIPGLYVAGDCAGVLGAEAAVRSGAAAGAAAAGGGHGGGGRGGGAGPRGRSVGAAMSRLTALRPAQVAAIADETVVCRCEDVTAGAIRTAVDAGAHDLNQMKHFNRCGMGPCQGRMCSDIAGEVMAIRLTGATDPATLDRARTRIGQLTGRVPLRPVPLGQIIGSFDYDDIPVPPPAPL